MAPPSRCTCPLCGCNSQTPPNCLWQQTKVTLPSENIFSMIQSTHNVNESRGTKGQTVAPPPSPRLQRPRLRTTPSLSVSTLATSHDVMACPVHSRATTITTVKVQNLPSTPRNPPGPLSHPSPARSQPQACFLSLQSSSAFSGSSHTWTHAQDPGTHPGGCVSPELVPLCSQGVSVV